MTHLPESDAVPLSESPQPAPFGRPPALRAAVGLLAVLAGLHLVELALWLLATLSGPSGSGLRRLIAGGMAEAALAVGFGTAAALAAGRRELGRLLAFTLSGLVVVRGLSHLISVVLTVAGYAIDWDTRRYLSASLSLVAAGLTALAVVSLSRWRPAPRPPEPHTEAGSRRPGAVLAAAGLLGCVAVIAGLAAALEGVELATGGPRNAGLVSHLTNVAVLFAALAAAYLVTAVLLAAGREAGRVAGYGCAGYLVWLGLQALAAPPEQLLFGVPAAAIGIAVIALLSGPRIAEWFGARRRMARE